MEDKPEKEKNMPVVSLAELLESGVHFGHLLSDFLGSFYKNRRRRKRRTK
jgi:ribosomal protein S2